MAIDYSGLFANPADIRARRVDELVKQQQALSMGGGSMAGLLGQVAGGGNVMGSLLAEGIARGAGLKTQEEKQAETAQNIFQSIDQNDPQSYFTAAEALNKAGLTKASLAMLGEGRALVDRKRTQAREDMRDQRALEKDARERVLFNQSQLEYARTEDERKQTEAIINKFTYDQDNPYTYYIDVGKELINNGQAKAGQAYLDKAEEWVTKNKDPAAVATYKFYKSLENEEDRQVFQSLQRKGNIFSDGKNIYFQGADNSIKKIGEEQLKPSEEPDIIREQEIAKAEGGIIGTNSAEIAQNTANAEAINTRAIDTIDALLDEGGRWEWGVGLSSIFNWVPGSPGADFAAKLSQVRGQSFLSEIDKLKGLGALSDAEGKAATDAANALNENMSEGEFMNQVKIIKENLTKARTRITEGKTLVKNARAQAQQKAETARQAPSTQTINQERPGKGMPEVNVQPTRVRRWNPETQQFEDLQG